MRENVVLRFNSHQLVDGIQEFTIEVSVVGKFNTHIVGASQEELMDGLNKTLKQVFAVIGEIPETVDRKLAAEEAEALRKAQEPQFFDEHGNRQPIGKMAATAKATFAAEIWRDGKKVDD